MSRDESGRTFEPSTPSPRIHRDIVHDKLYRELKPIEQEEIYSRFNQGDIIMVNYPGHEFHKRIARLKTDGVDGDGDCRVETIIKLEDTEEERDWFYVHYTRAVILKKI